MNEKFRTYRQPIATEYAPLLCPAYIIESPTTGQLFLQIFGGEFCDISKVRILSKRFNAIEGEQEFPRAWLRDSDDNIIRQGDIVWVIPTGYPGVEYLVIGSESNVSNEHFERYNVQSMEHRKRRYETANAIVQYSDNGNGEIDMSVEAQEDGTGNISLKLTGNGDDNGRVKVEASKDVAVNAPKIYLGEADNEAERIVLGDTWLRKFKELLTQLRTPGNIFTPVGPAQFSPAVVAEIIRLENTAEEMLSRRNFTM